MESPTWNGPILDVLGTDSGANDIVREVKHRMWVADIAAVASDATRTI